MWIIRTLLLSVICGFYCKGGEAAGPFYCAYKNEKISPGLNITIDAESAAFRDLIEHSKARRGVFVDKGYERCIDDKPGNTCYSLWGLDQTTNKYVIIRQGCWIQAEGTCHADKCDAHTPISDSTNFPSVVKFCCCHGNKCNDNKGQGQTSLYMERKPTMSKSNFNQMVPKKGSPICAYKSRDVSVKGQMESDADGLGLVLSDGKSANCTRGDFCFSFYTMDRNKTQITVIYQGCWNSADEKNTCNSSICTSHEEAKNIQQNGTSHFCCCRGDMCNNNISRNFIPYIHPTSKTIQPVKIPMDPAYRERTILISLLSVFCVAVIVLVLYLGYRWFCNPTHHSVNINNNIDIPSSPAFDIDDLKISCIISKGRYSEVWKGSLNEQDVAVKIYTALHRQYYYNEKYIYSLPYMEHENLLKFFGGEERILQDGNVQYLLVLQYVPSGTLMNYLKNNNLDWHTMCKMCQSVAKGMAHLHTDFGSGDNFKPTVAHRDINSRNILVQPDLSLVIADLGFCMTAMGSKLIHKGHAENAEQTSLTDVGTLRYMAPELLDGAVNLRDCEASLKQIDVYALGLVLWEISTRCVDLYQGCPMPEYQLPFHAEVDTAHPTFEEMQVLVSRNKVRPKFPEVWKDYNPAIRALKETIEECWDHDAEARLTAMCVEERIVEIKTLWSHHDNRNKGVTPTTALLANVTHGNRGGYHGNGQTQWGGFSSTTESSSPNIVAEGSTSALIINDIRESVVNRSESATTLPPTWRNEQSGSFSTSTMETTLAQTPSEPPASHPKSQNINAMTNQPLPPHQGRNPIVERNTHKRSDEELAVVGNNLYYGKDRKDSDMLQSPPGNSDLFDSLTDSLETSLMQNDVLNHHRSTPISYLQNQVNLNQGNGLELPPKKLNNPNQTNDNINTNQTQNRNIHSNVTPKVKKTKEIGFFGQLAVLGRLAFGGKFDSKKSVTETEHVAQSQIERGPVYDSVGQHNPIFEPSQSVETEVRLTNSGTVVRPAHLQTKQGKPSNCDPISSNLDRERTANLNLSDSSQEEVAVEIVDEIVEPEEGSPAFSRHRGAPYSKSTSDLSPQKHSKLEEEARLMRPSTLSLKGHNYKEGKGQPRGSLNSLTTSKGVGTQNFFKSAEARKGPSNGYKLLSKASKVCNETDDDDEQHGKIKLRVKTPVSEKKGRLSLYDDRLMSDGSSKLADTSKLQKPSMSLQQFNKIEETHSNVYTDCTC